MTTRIPARGKAAPHYRDLKPITLATCQAKDKNIRRLAWSRSNKWWCEYEILQWIVPICFPRSLQMRYSITDVHARPTASALMDEGCFMKREQIVKIVKTFSYQPTIDQVICPRKRSGNMLMVSSDTSSWMLSRSCTLQAPHALNLHDNHQ
jgi:hypothetical protein